MNSIILRASRDCHWAIQSRIFFSPGNGLLSEWGWPRSPLQKPAGCNGHMAHVSATEPCSSLLDSRTPLPSPPCVSCQSTGSLVHRVNPLCSKLAARDRKEVEGRGGIFRLLAIAEPRESHAAVETRNSGEEKFPFEAFEQVLCPRGAPVYVRA